MKRWEILSGINSPRDIKQLSYEELERLATEIREYIIDVVSKNGGHLAPSLGTIELTLALHKAFDAPKDKIIWDVGHQAYAHKIITGRREAFTTLRKKGGISGFPKRSESIYDTYNTGHSSTSISLGLGVAIAKELKGEDFFVVSVIGDGAMTAGLAFEGLNNAGFFKGKMIVVLNDNTMSIDKNVGAISNYLNSIITNPFLNRLKYYIGYKLIGAIPSVGRKLINFLERVETSVKGILLPGSLFEKMGFKYVGPFDGHNIKQLVRVFEKIKKIELDKPILVHVITQKGKGYSYAEQKPSQFHGVGPFLIKTGEIIKKKEYKSYSQVFGETILELAKVDDRVLAITAAMKEGTGLDKFAKTFPKRFFDVGIAEQHAITFSGALADMGFIPFVSIYSTFLQRAYDQLIHDIGLMNLPIRLIIDRGGIVGEDGETHHGIYDLVYMRTVPNFIAMAPKDTNELRNMIYTAYKIGYAPSSIRIPREVEAVSDEIKEMKELPIGKAEILRKGEYIAIYGIGRTVRIANEVAKSLQKYGYNPTVINLRFIKPIDKETISNISATHKIIVVLEDGVLEGGIGKEIVYISDGISPHNKFILKGYDVNTIIPQGRVDELMKEYGFSVDRIVEEIIDAEKTKEDRYIIGRT